MNNPAVIQAQPPEPASMSWTLHGARPAEPPDHALVFANAGHPPPLMSGPPATIYLEFPNSDLPLGIEAHLLPAIRKVKVPAGSLLVLYTDGVTERERKPLQGAAELHDAAIFARQLASRGRNH